VGTELGRTVVGESVVGLSVVVVGLIDGSVVGVVGSYDIIEGSLGTTEGLRVVDAAGS